MIEMNVGGIIVETVIEKLWDQYLEDKWSAEAPDDDVEKKLLGKDTPDGKGRKAVKCRENTHWKEGVEEGMGRSFWENTHLMVRERRCKRSC